MLKLLNFTVAKTDFAVTLESTRKVVPLVALKPLPKADACVVGMINLGGASVPVIDLSVRLDLANTNFYTLATSIVICIRDDQLYGIVADRIDGVNSIDDDAIELADMLGSDSMPYLGVYRTAKGRQTLVLDLEKILNLECRVELPPAIDQAAPVATDGTL